MKSTGQILNQTRIKANIDLKTIAKDTKIRPEFLAFIESDAYTQLPNSTVAKGFIRNYAEYLKLNPEHVLAVFRRDFIENYRGQIVPRGLADPVSSRFVWTPRLSLITGTVAILIFFFFYLFYQYRLLSGPPNLTINDPKEGIVTTENIVTVTGKTDPEATVSIQGEKIPTQGGGNFSFRWELPTKGEQEITIIAVSKSGKTSSITRNIIYK